MKKVLIFLSLIFSIFLIAAATAYTPVTAAVLPSATATFETSLASPITTSATSMTLTANSVRGGGSISGYACFIIDEGSTQAETVCGTVAGTSVTSMTRGISQSTGTTTVAALQFSHRRGANVKISDFPLIQILKAQNAGQDTFSTTIHYTSGVTPAATDDLTDKEYVDSIAFSGASIINASTVAKGIVQIATAGNAAASTDTGSSAAILVLPSSLSTTTWNSGTAATRILMSGSNKRLDSNFIASTTSQAATTTLQLDTAGNVYALPAPRLVPITTLTNVSITNSSTTAIKFTLPANSLGTNGVLHLKAWAVVNGGSNMWVDFGTGAAGTTTSSFVTSGAGSRALVFFDYFLTGNGATNAQKAIIDTRIASTSNGTGWVMGQGLTGATGTSTPAYDTTLTQTFYVIAASGNSSTPISFDQAYIELLR